MSLNGKGALTGAASGAAMGAALGPYGAIAGGVIGGAVGLFSGGDDQSKFQAVDPYTQAPPDSALGQALLEQQQTQQQQQALAGALNQQATGQGPSAANTTLNQAVSQAGANANGMVAADRGHYSGMALRDALLANNQQSQQAAATGVAARQNEMATAQGELGSLYGNMSNEDLNQQQLISGSSLAAQKINAGTAGQNSQQATTTDNAMMGGLMNGAGAVLSHTSVTPASTPAATPAVSKAHGGRIPGQARVQGDSLKNDTVNAKLSPGEIVIPRSHAHNAELAKEFIDELMTKQKKAKSGAGGYGRVLQAHRELGKALESVGAK